jgi:drug/metabolite transporter (DMT)-like permease
LSSAICFATGAICFKIGQRTNPRDNGLFLSIFINVVLLGAIAAFLQWPAWNRAGVIGLIVGGRLGTGGGRSSNLKAIRAIGPSRSNAFLAGNPVVAAIAGWFVLDERLGVQEFVGGALVVIGLVWLVRARARPDVTAEKPPITGYLWAMAAPAFFGAAFVVRKWSLELFPGSVIGAFIGATAALVVVTYTEGRSTSTGALLRRNLASPQWWYVGAGIATSLALLSQFTAFSYLPAWVVGILQGTQGIWTLALGWLFLRQEERIDRRLVGAVILVAVGVILIGLEV